MEYTNTKSRDPFVLAIAITIDHGLIALPLWSVEMKRDINRRAEDVEGPQGHDTVCLRARRRRPKLLENPGAMLPGRL